MADFDYLPAGFITPSPGTIGSTRPIHNSGTLATGALALNKTSRICRVPRGFVLTGVRFRMGDGDSNGAPALVIKIGDDGDDDRILTTNTVGQAGGEVTALADAGFLYEFTEDTDIILTASTAAATAQAAAFKIALMGYIK